MLVWVSPSISEAQVRLLQNDNHDKDLPVLSGGDICQASDISLEEVILVQLGVSLTFLFQPLLETD